MQPLRTRFSPAFLITAVTVALIALDILFMLRPSGGESWMPVSENLWLFLNPAFVIAEVLLSLEFTNPSSTYTTFQLVVQLVLLLLIGGGLSIAWFVSISTVLLHAWGVLRRWKMLLSSVICTTMIGLAAYLSTLLTVN